MLIVVAYDVADDARRVAIASEMANFGTRVQWSVFECHLDRRRLETLRQRLHRMIDPTTDRVTCYPVCRKDAAQIIIDGRGRVSADWDYAIV
jgi:CRISPR-associated protein Cas2